MTNVNKEKLIEVKNIDIVFGSGKKQFKAVDNVSFDIYKGETFGLVGESGSGKTTIGRAIMRINPITNGEILFHGEKINGRISSAWDKEITQRIQMIFQDPGASLNERAKVDYIISEGLINNKKFANEQEREEKVKKALLEVGLLPEFASRFPHEFSGGQRQRIGIRVNAIAPGIIETEMNNHLDEDEKAAILEEIPLQRYGSPEEVANLTSFIMSGKADYMTGQILRINGGWYI